MKFGENNDPLFKKIKQNLYSYDTREKLFMVMFLRQEKCIDGPNCAAIVVANNV